MLCKREERTCQNTKKKAETGTWEGGGELFLGLTPDGGVFPGGKWGPREGLREENYMFRGKKRGRERCH